MNEDLNDVIVFYVRKLMRMEEVTAYSIKEIIQKHPFGVSAGGLSDEQKNQVEKELESRFDITQDRGTSVKSDYTPWLKNHKQNIDFYYWNRLREYLLHEKAIPPRVISRLDVLSDEVLDYCGNPSDAHSWSRRGMVIGHVQSGKTTNYTALICKAADAGYKVIILLAGLTNLLRSQTQQRIDETFIGKKSIFRRVVDEQFPILRYALSGERRFPHYATTRDHDFNRKNAETLGFSLARQGEPMIFITKKNKSTLENLKLWIQDQGQSANLPLLLIDDEADNASINTSKNPKRSTAINAVIREILQQFNQSSYIGYTATPFANIFIDPKSREEMLGDDLFPRHFIKAIDPPTNYVGAGSLFCENGDLRNGMIRIIDDYADSLPLVQNDKHKYPAGDMPESLKKAIRIFLLTLAIRYLRGDGKKHCSMMINVSRFNDVQEKVEDKVYEYLNSVKNSVEVGALSLGKPTDLKIAALQEDFKQEFCDCGYNLDEVMSCLHQAISSVQIITVNTRGKKKLDYEQNKENGLHVIAIGGFALSRGLTLEGLTVSYIIRNAAASDTLMQMARWFGYRNNYEDICRLYLPEVSREHYDHVYSAIQELDDEIRFMESLDKTPEEFGLKVRQSPTGIDITAANKMRSATKVMLAQDYSGRHIEGHALLNNEGCNEKHKQLVKKFMRDCGQLKINDKGMSWSNVPGKKVLAFVNSFEFPERVREMTKNIYSDSGKSLLDDYLGDRLSRGELSAWDVYLPTLNLKTDHHQDWDDGWFLDARFMQLLRTREAYDFDLKAEDVLRITKDKNRVADPKDAGYGLFPGKEEEVRKLKGIIKGEERRFCYVRSRPLLIIHLLRLADGENKERLQMQDPAVTFSICLPKTGIASIERTYKVNRVYQEEMLRQARDNEDDDELVDEE